MDNNFKDIKFCDGIGYQLTNSTIITFILNKLTKYYKLEIDRAYSKYFKFCEASDINTLKKERYLAYYNFSAPLTLLFLTTYNGINFCFYIKKQAGSRVNEVDIISTKHRFSDVLYQNDTLFEGKLVKGVQGWNFLINDLVIHEKHTYNVDFVQKLQTINDILLNKFIADPVLDVAHINLQDFVDYAYLSSFIGSYKSQQSYSNQITGIIFRSNSVSCNKNIIFPFNTEIKELNLPEIGKNKPIVEKINPDKIRDSHRNICFKLKKTNLPDVYELYLTDGVNDVFYDHAGVSSLETSRLIKSLFPAEKYHYIFVNCKWDPNFLKWEPYRRSTRKNADSVYLFT